ncbi:transposase [Arthrobacter silvisoli]|uniref:transposase n=1 Tax=Arthrobacter silvisoli TaxID=2291022 RepID=UPI0014438F17|nr:transposase [Arthrobacter silvisoli]
MSTRDIGSHLEEIYGTKVSAWPISRATDVIAHEVARQQNRPSESVRLDAVAPRILGSARTKPGQYRDSTTL